MTYLYGLTHSNKDFESGDAFGKNTFTTAFPIALANYLACEKNLPMNYIVADLGEGDAPTTKHKLTPLKDIIGCDPYDAEYHFEDSFEQYSQYAVNEANRSDIVVKNRITGDEVSAFEVKLVAVPTSGKNASRRTMLRAGCSPTVYRAALFFVCRIVWPLAQTRSR